MLLAREQFLAGCRLTEPALALARGLLGPSAVAAFSLAELVAAVDCIDSALQGVTEPADLWRAGG